MYVIVNLETNSIDLVHELTECLSSTMPEFIRVLIGKDILFRLDELDRDNILHLLHHDQMKYVYHGDSWRLRDSETGNLVVAYTHDRLITDPRNLTEINRLTKNRRGRRSVEGYN